MGILDKPNPPVTKPTDPDSLVLEAWAQGYMIGSLVIMACITIANMRRGVLLHKLILLELFLGMWMGTFIFNHAPVYGWYLSATAIPLNTSWILHNVIAWMKNRPFLSRRVSLIYISTVIAIIPYWVIEIYANFAYFNNYNTIFLHTRPYEALFRDPWWIFTTISLFWNITNRYEFGIFEILRISPRFAVMVGAMCLSICFLVVDICSVTGAFNNTGLPKGLNPFWKLSFVFKCLTDSVILDDFKTALDRLRAFKIGRLGSFAVDQTNKEGAGAWGLRNIPSHDGWMRTGSKDANVTHHDHAVASPPSPISPRHNPMDMDLEAALKDEVVASASSAESSWKGRSIFGGHTTKDNHNIDNAQ